METLSVVAYPAIVTAGDTRAAKAIHGESKVFLEVAGMPLVAHVVESLQAVPEISEVWVVGNRSRLEQVLRAPAFEKKLRKPLFLIEQRRNLMENCWEGFRCFLARDPDAGRDPVGDEVDQSVLYVSGDLPFAMPEELSEFIRRSEEIDCDYALGLVTEASLAGFLPAGPGGTGIEVAYFNLREGRVRQSNLHFARPARLGNRDRIEEMYEHRHQRKFWNMAILAWRLFWSRAAGPQIVWFYLLMHLGGLADRWHMRAVADFLRRFVTIEINERVVSRVLDTRFRFVITEAGGCGIDIDTEEELAAVREHYTRWYAEQRQRASELYGLLGEGAPSGGAHGKEASSG